MRGERRMQVRLYQRPPILYLIVVFGSADPGFCPVLDCPSTKTQNKICWATVYSRSEYLTEAHKQAPSVQGGTLLPASTQLTVIVFKQLTAKGSSANGFFWRTNLSICCRKECFCTELEEDPAIVATSRAK